MYEIQGPLLIVGASHQGEVVLDLLVSLPHPPEVLGFIDSGREGSFVGRSIGGLPVLDGIRGLGRYASRVRGAVPAVGDGAAREEIIAVLAREGIAALPAVHRTAVLSGGVHIGPGAVVHAGAVIGVGARIGCAAIINTAAVVDHHAHVGDYAHIAPGARLAGGVRVGERAWVGIGATVLENLALGPDAVVGAGAVVTRDVEAESTVVGVPARPIVEGGAVAAPNRDVVERDPA